MDSPNSDLSDYASDDFPEDVKGRRLSFEHTPDHDTSSGRPSKRPRLNLRANSDPPAPVMAAADDFGELSEDTDGSVPASPHHPGMSADDDYGQDQVTVCKWEACEAGDLENMDKLVEHLHDDHIGVRQKKYSCEWSDCTRKGIPHASGYALRAHMRSHTREKPFYCTLPECDRSFTRSDALAKHMRTVHETEALRPSDPVPKHHSSNPLNKFQRLKLVLGDKARHQQDKGSTPASPSSHPPNSAGAASTQPPSTDTEYSHNNVMYMQDLASPNAPAMVQFPPDMNFTPHELSLPAPDLFRLLRRQLHWATQEGEQLRAEAEVLEKKRRDEWVAKELILENLMEAELAQTKRQCMEKEKEILDEPESIGLLEEDVAPSKFLEIKPKADRLPWWREEEWLKRLVEGKDVREGVPEREVRTVEIAPQDVAEKTIEQVEKEAA
ncbi:uncharacterized protein BDR25DRAFT_116034 [Lindgomyces ingoldianus]|uniref:Uncharacterized protein n=1 Tax=Lindgomyces ingoldianus TaxID=673940 RepID=A0ACB6QA03_9PLEO|nr:uncharacterized protein BDR25DRAFT_116034 [Lindgomyces ingoldianus]KAF2463197.1 hypothetical protein BDR25DRAFT_116034 [Lindgomyces ingoldianus]